MIKKIRNTIIFDFDGVILNSHTIKTRAFYKIFSNYGKKIANRAKSIHLKNAGVSRFIKFNLILKKIIKTKSDKKKLTELQKKFDIYSAKKIKKLKINKYLLNFLLKNYKIYNFYISTGTPQKEILKLTKEKKINKYFVKIFGSPRKKIDHIKIIKKNNQRIIFIGDSKEDYISSTQSKILFIAKINSESKNYFRKKNIPKIYDFKNLEKKIKYLFNNQIV